MMGHLARILSRLLLATSFFVGVGAPNVAQANSGAWVLMAQTDGAVSDNAAPNPEPATHATGIPHGKFLVDYVLVLALCGAVLYAVCRSSRRV